MGWVFLTCIGSVQAALSVVGDQGHSIPASSYTQSIVLPTQADLSTVVQQQQNALVVPQTSQGDPRFPMNSDLTPGAVSTHQLTSTSYQRAFFVIGNDAMSIDWFNKHKAQLQSLHAVGLVTNVQNVDEFDQLEKQTGMTLLAVSLDGAGKAFDVSHYPFVVAKGWVQQ